MAARPEPPARPDAGQRNASTDPVFLQQLKDASERLLAGDGTGAAAECRAIYALARDHAPVLATAHSLALLDETIGHLEVLSRAPLDAATGQALLSDLGFCLSLDGDVERAAACFAEACRRAPQPPTGNPRDLALYDLGLAHTQTPDSPGRRERFGALLGLLERAAALKGEVAECGCWRGLSSYLLCSRLRDHDPAFDGKGYRVFDSFAGLSRPTGDDGVAPALEGLFAAPLQTVRANLAAFPGIEFHPGWIPDSLAGLPERRYRFVHVDVDLYVPTRGALAYFLPRLAPGGVLVCDDYNWAGARRAVREMASALGMEASATPTGQAYFVAGAVRRT